MTLTLEQVLAVLAQGLCSTGSQEGPAGASLPEV